MNIQNWFPLGLTGLISLQSKGFSRVFSSMTIWKDQFFSAQPSLWSNSYLYMTTGKTIVLTIWSFVGKVMSLLCNTFVIAFLPRSKHLLISWQQSLCAVILQPRKINLTVSIFSPSVCHEMMGPSGILVFWMLCFNMVFHSPLSLSVRGSLVPLHFQPSGWCHLHIWGYWYFSWQF